MNSKELKSILIRQWPHLRKPWFGDDPIMCRDAEYGNINSKYYMEVDAFVWVQIKGQGLIYGSTFPDCDDFSDIKLGLFKERWWQLIQDGIVPANTAPAYAVVDGYNPYGELHDWNLFVVESGIWISDYGDIVEPDGYKPLKVRF